MPHSAPAWARNIQGTLMIQVTTSGLLATLSESLGVSQEQAEMIANAYAGEPHKASIAYDAMLFIQSAQEKIDQLQEEF